jgi:hypothetical protein
MQTSTAVGNVLIASVALAILGGCSSGTQIAPTPSSQGLGLTNHSAQNRSSHDPRMAGILARHRGIVSFASSTTRSFMTPGAASKPLFFVATNDIDIYQSGSHQSLVGQIGVSSSGLATDSAGNLYVATTDANGIGPFAGGEVLVYAPPYTGTPMLTLKDDDYFPQGVAVSKRGVVGLANFCGGKSCTPGSGSFTFYAPNSATPCATVADPDLAYMFYDAFDKKGNLYFTADDLNYNAVIGEIEGGCNAKAITILTTANPLTYPYGIQVDRAGRIAIINSGGSNYDVLDVYDAPTNGSLGMPVSVVDLVTPAYPIAFAFSASNADVYSAEQGSGGLANTYAFPAGGNALESITVGGAPEAVAVTPARFP